MSIDQRRLMEIAHRAAQLDPQHIRDMNAKMEAEMIEKMKTMPYEERLKLLAVQKVMTQRTVEALKSAGNGNGIDLSLEQFRPQMDSKSTADDELLTALRSRDLSRFKATMTAQKRSPFAQVKYITDDESHPLIHWAALENDADAISFLISMVAGSEVQQLVDQRNARGETPLMWACTKGNKIALFCLLRHGADVHAACHKGYTAMHVAAQNGQVMSMAYLSRRGLSIDVRDNNGRTPLHWAAYKGFDRETRWLLSHGADPGAQDWEKCTPLHWAALKAHPMVMATLCDLGASGPFLGQADSTGGTPLTLAQDKIRKIDSELEKNPEGSPGFNIQTKRLYERVVAYAARRSEVEASIVKNGGRAPLMVRIGAKMPHWSYFMWPVLAPIGYYQYFFTVLPITQHHLWVHLIFNLTFWAKWCFWLRLQVRDPGEFVEPHGPAGTTLGVGPEVPSWGWRRGGFPDFRLRKSPLLGLDDFEVSSDKRTDVEMGSTNRLVHETDARATRVTRNPAMREWAMKHRVMYDRVLQEGLDVPVCLTCEIVKPVRAKHDKISDVCVAKFDHFCPWMNSCVGELNYADFFFTALSATIAMWLWLYLIVQYTWEVDAEQSWWSNFAAMWKWECFAWIYSLMAIYGLGMTAQHIHLAAKNLSTNEMISGFRYRYLVEDGTRGNPFNRGVLSNFAELVGLLPPLKMDPEQYYSVELAGGPTRPVPDPIPGSPWYRRGGGSSHGHSHGGEEEDHGHSHGQNGGDHGHSHSAPGGGHGHTH